LGVEISGERFTSSESESQSVETDAQQRRIVRRNGIRIVIPGVLDEKIPRSDENSPARSLDVARAEDRRVRHELAVFSSDADLGAFQIRGNQDEGGAERVAMRLRRMEGNLRAADF